MAYVEVEVEYDFDDAWDELSDTEKRDFARQMAKEYDLIPPEPTSYDMSDPIKLLEIITDLRKKGYKVEPS